VDQKPPNEVEPLIHILLGIDEKGIIAGHVKIIIFTVTLNWNAQQIM
jgi:hypothetical protein